MKQSKSRFARSVVTLLCVLLLFPSANLLASSARHLQMRVGKVGWTTRNTGALVGTTTPKIETSFGLYTTKFDTLEGTVTVNLPDDLAAGDTISGTVRVLST